MLSPAKINLGLRVYNRRLKDGYHYLESIFIPISFGDDIHFEPSETNEIITENLLPENRKSDFEAVSERGTIEKNLLWKILDELKPVLPEGVSIRLTKRIPTGAGLGGGSSNAGLLLRYLKQKYSLPEDLILQTAEKFGSDIPFFLNDTPMLVRGTGEIMQPVSVGPGSGILCIPNFNVLTKFAYAELKRPLQPGTPPKTWTLISGDLLDALQHSEWHKLGSLTNDFEEIVFKQFPVLSVVKRVFIEKGARYSAMSGSGSSLYALTESDSAGKNLLQTMSALFPEMEFVPFRLVQKIATEEF